MNPTSPQSPQSMPSCIQNAMMKDKKPFTYTPGGIDLSQIKSPRMAKRIQMNANSQGVQNQPKISPLAQPNATNVVQSMGAAAMGMPFQVFPTGPTSKPASTTTASPSIPPPPPPPPPKLTIPAPTSSQLTPTNNNNSELNGGSVKSQENNNNNNNNNNKSFEPPPMGCRPEIKIPPNPIASLRRSPRPQPKDDYWIEEYRQEKGAYQQPSPPPIQSMSPPIEQTRQNFSPVESVKSPPPAPPMPPMPPTSMPLSPISMPKQTESPMRYVVDRSPDNSPIPANLPPPISPIKTPISTPVKEEVQPMYQRVPISQPSYKVEMPTSPIEMSQMPAQNYAAQQEKPRKIIMSTMPQMPTMMKEQPQYQPEQESNVLYIPATPQWMKSIDRSLLQEQQQQQLYQQAMQMKERIIPISFEKASTPVRTPISPGFGPQPYMHNISQYANVQPASVITPKPDPNANQFVNQGYNNISFSESPRMMPQQQQQQQQPQYPSGTRIIPIQIEGNNNYQNRTPFGEHTVVIQSNPRSSQSPRSVSGNSGGNQTPVQSPSFNILQQITEGDAQEVQPLYARQISEQDLKRLQISDSRMKNQGTNNNNNNNNNNNSNNNQKYMQTASCDESSVPPSEQQVKEPNLYQGSSIPSRKFKILQNAVNQAAENAGPGFRQE
jgi:hypothetical protein